MPASMDIDDDTAITRDTAQAPAGPDITPTGTQQPNSSSSSKPLSSSDEVLQLLGAAADHPERLDVRAPAAAAMADADDPGEDDVDRLQVRPGWTRVVLDAVEYGAAWE